MAKSENATKGKGQSPDANPIMSCVVREVEVKRSVKGFRKDDWPRAARMQDERRDSTVKMDLVAVRYPLLTMVASPPRPVDTPTPSRMEERNEGFTSGIG